MKRENAELIEDLKVKLQTYKNMCNIQEKDLEILKDKVTTLQDELNNIGTNAYYVREAKELQQSRK